MGNIMAVDLKKNYSPFMDLDRAENARELADGIFDPQWMHGK
jgi:hypothetical protein